MKYRVAQFSVVIHAKKVAKMATLYLNPLKCHTINNSKKQPNHNNMAALNVYISATLTE